MDPAVGVAAARAGVLITNLVISEVLVVAAVTGKDRQLNMQRMLKMVPERAEGETPTLVVALAERMVGGRNVAVAVEEEEAEVQRLQLRLRRRRLRLERQRTERTVCLPLRTTLLALRSHNIN